MRNAPWGSSFGGGMARTLSERPSAGLPRAGATRSRLAPRGAPPYLEALPLPARPARPEGLMDQRVTFPLGEAASPRPAEHPPVRSGRIGVLLMNLGTPEGTDYRSM